LSIPDGKTAIRFALSQIRQRVRWLHPKYWPIRAKYRRCFTQPKVVHIVGMPRTGSTLAKRYLGDHEGLQIASAGEYFQAWRLADALEGARIVVDKNTVNLGLVDLIRRKYGNQAWFLCIVRDPRDELISLLETDRHQEIPRDESFWLLWEQRYSSLLQFAERYGPRGTRVALVRYEDLASDPVGTKRAFLGWLGLHDAGVTDTYNTMVEQIALGIDETEDWKTHQTSVVHTDSVGRWRTADAEVEGLLQAYAKFPRVVRLMELLGYGDQVVSPAVSTQHLTIIDSSGTEHLQMA
jgi:hypothetical protein